MSRTRKDAPHWVRGLQSPNRHATHSYLCIDHGFVRLPEYEPCTLDDPHAHRWNQCRWAVDDRDYLLHSDKDIRDRFYGPERAHVRDTLRAATRDHTARGHTDIQPDPVRRRGPFRGGWWD